MVTPASLILAVKTQRGIAAHTFPEEHLDRALKETFAAESLHDDAIVPWSCVSSVQTLKRAKPLQDMTLSGKTDVLEERDVLEGRDVAETTDVPEIGHIPENKDGGPGSKGPEEPVHDDWQVVEQSSSDGDAMDTPSDSVC